MSSANADTEALQHAIDSGTPIESRTYVIDESVRLPSNVDIDGNGATIKAVDGPWEWDPHRPHNDLGMFNAKEQKNIRLHNFRFVGVTGQPHGKTPKLIYFKRCESVIVEDCHFSDHSAEGVWGDVYGGTFRKLTFERVGKGRPGGKWKALPALQPFGGQLTIEHNILLDCGSGIGPTGRDVTVRYNRVIGVLQDGIAIGDSATFPEGPARVENNYVELTADTKTRQSAYSVIGTDGESGWIVLRNNRAFVTTTKRGIVARGITVANASEVTLINNRIVWTGDSLGLEIYGTERRQSVTTNGNLLISLDGQGHGIRATPSVGRTVKWHGIEDQILGLDALSIVLDCSEYRGGEVQVMVDETWIESGYVRSTDGKMRSVKRERVSL